MISDPNGSLKSRHFLYVVNERTSFASWASAFENSRLFITLNELLTKKVAKSWNQCLNRFEVI